MTFAELETALGCALAFLASPGNPRIGLALIAELRFKARLASFSALFSERVPAESDENLLNEFRSEAHAIEDERNRLIHSFYWAGPVGDRRVTRIKATAKERNGLRIQFEEVHPDDVLAVAGRAWTLVDRLDGLCRSVGDFESYVGQFYALFRED